jgi:hypothetical protein
LKTIRVGDDLLVSGFGVGVLGRELQAQTVLAAEVITAKRQRKHPLADQLANAVLD